MSLSEDSRLLALPNGFNVIKSDYISLVTNLRTYLNNGIKTRATASPISVSGFSEKVHVLEVLNQDQSVKERIFISISHGVPVQWDIFSNGKLFSSVSFTNYKPNQGFRDEIFKL
jgi:outer membrane lipoprotein-sorting protein